MVVFPSATGMPLACQLSVPTAVPVAPFEVCQVTRAIPAPPDAVPLIEVVDPATVTTGATEASIETLIACPDALATNINPETRTMRTDQIFCMIFLSTKYFRCFTKIFNRIKSSDFERHGGSALIEPIWTCGDSRAIPWPNREGE